MAAYAPRASPSCRKVCGGGGGVVCKPILVIDLGPLPSSDPTKGGTRTFNTFFERKKEIIIFKICVINHQFKQCNQLLCIP